MDGESGRRHLARAVAAQQVHWTGVAHEQDVPDLLPGAIHAYALDLATVPATAFSRVLDDSDRLRGARIRDREKRTLYLGGRFGLKRLLSWYTGLPTHQLQFGYGDRGKPTLLNVIESGRIEFNYTLSRDKVLYAFTRDVPLGVDMEVLPRVVNASHMAKTRLTSGEREAWLALPDAAKNDAMLCCWTRKEAYGKALGVGIRFRLGDVALFENLASPVWMTSRAGLFSTTSVAGMPDSLLGMQLGMPFAAVASIMVGATDSSTGFPALTAHRLQCA